MHRWYVKAHDQTDYAARAALLGCSIILESTSTQVNPAIPLPHVIIQTRLGVNHVFPEPTSSDALNAVRDEPETPVEAMQRATQAVREAARGRLSTADVQAVLDPNARAILNDLLTALGLTP